MGTPSQGGEDFVEGSGEPMEIIENNVQTAMNTGQRKNITELALPGTPENFLSPAINMTRKVVVQK